jgi:hypothetical protein
MRRPPQLWEQRLARLTSVLGVGLSSNDTTSIVTPGPPPGDGGGVEPAPVLPAPGLFIKPSTPTLLGSVQGINVLWNGLNSAGEIWPYDTAWCEIHMSTTGTAFTPGTATLKGRLTRPGSYFVGGLTAGTTYYFRLRGADPAGYFTDPSDAASGQTGLTASGDYGTATIGTGAVSFNARTIGGVTNTVGSATPSSPLEGDIWLDTSPGTAIIHKVYNSGVWVTNAWGSASIAAGQITALQVAAGAITAGAIAAGAVTTDKLTAGTISGFYISGGTISGGYITGGTVNGGFVSGGTVEGARFQTRAGSSSIRVDDDVSGPFGTSDAIEFISGSTSTALMSYVTNSLNVYSDIATFVKRNGTTGVVVVIDGEVSTNDITAGGTLLMGFSNGDRAFRVASDGTIYSNGIDDNTTASAANVRIGTSAQLLKSTSTERVKDHIISLCGDLAGVDPAKISTEPASANPYDVLEIAPVEFQSLAPTDGGQRLLGFIAENVAEVFPWAAEWDEDGIPSSVSDRPVVAALLAVVKDQQTAIMELTARVAALEA